MSPPLEGKRVVVAGGSRGIGRAVALACARDGANVAITYRARRDAAEETAALVRERHGTDTAMTALDARDDASIERAVAELCERLGGIDGWVSAFGAVQPGLFVTSDPGRLREQIETNLVGPMLSARAVLEVMMRQRGGVLLFVSSVAAARPSRGQAAYAAAKGGVEALTRALAVEYAKKKIRVLCVRPGAVDTEMLAATRAIAEAELVARIPAGRVASAEEVAEHAAFLLGDRAAYATGSIVTVDGGYSVA
jgi:3-oxoacyl-[acyl-carrier protein] reductase